MRILPTFFIRRFLVLGAVAAITAVTAAAQNVTYMFSGVGTGTLGAQSFASTGFSFSVTVPTASVSTQLPGVVGVANVVMNFTIDGIGSGTLGNAYVFNNQTLRTVGFGNVARSDLINLENIASLASYDMISAFGPVTATGSNLFFSQFLNVATSAGALTMSNVATATFEASTVGEPGVVPEPSTYALLGTGLIAIGGLARRRRSNV